MLGMLSQQLGSGPHGYRAFRDTSNQMAAALREAAEAKERSLSVAGQEDTKVAYYAEDDAFAYGLPGNFNALGGGELVELLRHRRALAEIAASDVQPRFKFEQDSAFV